MSCIDLIETSQKELEDSLLIVDNICKEDVLPVDLVIQASQYWTPEMIFECEDEQFGFGDLMAILYELEEDYGDLGDDDGIIRKLQGVMNRSEDWEKSRMVRIFSFGATKMYFQESGSKNRDLLLEFLNNLSTFAREQSESETWRFLIILMVISCSSLEFKPEHMKKVKRVLDSLEDLMKHEVLKYKRFDERKREEDCSYEQPFLCTEIRRHHVMAVRILESVLSGAPKATIKKMQKFASYMIMTEKAEDFCADNEDSSEFEEEDFMNDSDTYDYDHMDNDDDIGYMDDSD